MILKQDEMGTSEITMRIRHFLYDPWTGGSGLELNRALHFARGTITIGLSSPLCFGNTA